MNSDFEIHCEGLGKRFNYEWIFRNFTYYFTAGNSYAILGTNGSGKSTLIQTLAGFLSSSEGTLSFKKKDEIIQEENFYKHISLASPYLELIEEFTLQEIISFQSQFKPFIENMKAEQMADKMELAKHRNKQIRYFSSGMKQRLKLALAVFCEVPVILLDEPATNLDAEGLKWYHRLMEENISGRMVLVASNQQAEYDFCKMQLNMAEYKSKGSF